MEKLTTKEDLKKLFLRQIMEWPQARHNYSYLSKVQERVIQVKGFDVKLQYNPARIVSTVAQVDSISIKKRKCFLCENARPSQQEGLNYTALSGKEYTFLVNPFPIFKEHYTIVSTKHEPQSLFGRLHDLLEITNLLEDYVVFYNGPGCGASAPDHFHFQAGKKKELTLEDDVFLLKNREIASTEHSRIVLLKEYYKSAYWLTSNSLEEASEMFTNLYNIICGHRSEESGEMEYRPKLNVLCWKTDEIFNIVIIQRKAHRPACYYSEGADRITISPGAVDMAGIFILPLEEDYKKLDTKAADKIIDDVCLDESDIFYQFDAIRHCFLRKQPYVSVGVMSSNKLNVDFLDGYKYGRFPINGTQVFRSRNDQIEWNGHLYNELLFHPVDYKASFFSIPNVRIGINFHWDREEILNFQGSVKIIVENNKLRLINVLGVEEYLLSVISSEMNSNAPKEFLKAHAIISRSWLMRILESNSKKTEESKVNPLAVDIPEKIKALGLPIKVIRKWYDHTDHNNFDVCADDHCQRYQGLPKDKNSKIETIIDDTWGEMLYDGDTICDARFSKCCGGITEKFSTCWEDYDKSYLSSILDNVENVEEEINDNKVPINFPDLTNEQEFEKWVLSSPEAFCNIKDDKLISKILKDYDKETKNFYRWTESCNPKELSELLRSKSGEDIGLIKSFIPLNRGTSGRLSRLAIVGEKAILIVSKELEIRRVLSQTHLYSSAFIVKEENGNFVFYGAGWGHGVGLCQIGAAAMGDKNYTYKQILNHYYHDIEIKAKY
ncbi:MAG: DUF4922 domain-containing protein [Bacteroidales bacterium]